MVTVSVLQTVLTIVVLWIVPATHQQIMSRYFREGSNIDVAAVIDPFKVTWTNISTKAMCSAYCVRRKCACTSFSFVNGSCNMFGSVISGPPGNDTLFSKTTECAAPKELPNTHVLTHTGCSATYACNYGYETQTTDPNTLTCTADETWAPSGYQCGLIPCQHPPQLDNGQVAVTTLQVGTSAIYSCLADYTNRGGTVNQITCLLGGTWSGVTDMLCKITKVSYTVMILTGDLTDSGTDAEVFLWLYGDYDSLKLTFSDGYYFEKGHLDVLNTLTIDVGTLSYIEVGHDNSGVGAGWYVRYVSVDIDGTFYKIWVNKWVEDPPHYVRVYVS